jgi:methionine-R-sulfoxide reductase
MVRKCRALGCVAWDRGPNDADQLYCEGRWLRVGDGVGHSSLCTATGAGVYRLAIAISRLAQDVDEILSSAFACAGCDLPLFSSDTKYESGTGWPSFWQPLDNALGKTEDRTFGMLRTEVHCRRCGGHLGHVFDDGPQPTGLRYCIDGFGLVFHPAGPSAS